MFVVERYKLGYGIALLLNWPCPLAPIQQFKLELDADELTSSPQNTRVHRRRCQNGHLGRCRGPLPVHFERCAAYVDPPFSQFAATLWEQKKKKNTDKVQSNTLLGTLEVLKRPDHGSDESR